MEYGDRELKPYQLTGAMQMYEASGEEIYKDYVMSCLQEAADLEDRENLLPLQDTLAYFFGLKHTGQESYRQKIEMLIKEQQWTLDFLPFAAAYETNFNRKEHYNEIAAHFREKGEFTGTDLVALIETIGQISEEIYEYYRELRDLFKTVIKEKINHLPDSPEKLEIGYSILRACNMGILQKEKYSEAGELVWKTIADSCDGNTCGGLQEMLKAQYAILKKREK
ncbi:MAG: hypothetical protein QM657_11150 [Lacrimispora sp.]|uniref:hypothetical protein n=1 Tax=Lacrimispora sp. TaxID=2719234 RepID=UPI0039E6E852